MKSLANTSFLTEPDKGKKTILFVFHLLFVAVLFLFYLHFNSYLYIIGLIGAAALLYWLLFSVENTIILLFLYIIILPSSFGADYDFFHGFYIKIPVLLLLLFFVLLWIWMDNLLTREKSGTQLHDLDDLLIVFLVIAAVSLLRGLLEGYAYYHVITEGVFILFYGFYFVFLRNKSLLQIKKLTMALVIFSFIVSIEYLLLTFQEGKIATIALQRIVTRQPYIALFTVPVLVSNIFFQKRIWIKILSIIAAFPIIAMVLISQWRGLWLGFLISSFAVVFLALNRDKFSFQKILKFIVLLILIMTTLVITILIIDQLFIGSAIVSLLNRGLSFTDVMGDDSIIMRISDTRRAWQQMQGSIVDILFGKGLGASYDRNSIYMTYPYQVDCTYIYIFWKMGLVGLLTFLLIGFKVFKKGFYAFKNTQDLFIKYITASLLSGFIGLYIASITSVCSIIYQFTIVWAFMISAVEIVYLKVRSEIIIPRRNNEQV